MSEKRHTAAKSTITLPPLFQTYCKFFWMGKRVFQDLHTLIIDQRQWKKESKIYMMPSIWGSARAGTQFPSIAAFPRWSKMPSLPQRWEIASASSCPVHNVYFVKYDVTLSFLAQVIDTVTYFVSHVLVVDTVTYFDIFR